MITHPSVGVILAEFKPLLLDIVQCAASVNTNHGYVNLIMNEYAYYGKGHTIHSSGQIEWHKKLVDDKSVKVGGTQCITTLDGYAFP